MHSRQTRPPRCQQIVGDDDAHTGSDRILVHLKRVHPIFELIADALGFRGKLLGLSNRNETGAEVIRERRGENEFARFNAKDGIGLNWTNLLGQSVDDFTKTRLVLEYGCDVIKEDVLLMNIWILADYFLQIIHVSLELLMRNRNPTR